MKFLWLKIKKTKQWKVNKKFSLLKKKARLSFNLNLSKYKIIKLKLLSKLMIFCKFLKKNLK